ncbi:hypothetical protein Tco_0150927 [Tanacetum coccineum]
MMQSSCEKLLQQQQAADINQSTLQEMTLQEMEDLKQHYLDEMLSLSNQIQIKDYRNEKIDIHFRRECEITIDELKDVIPDSIQSLLNRANSIIFLIEDFAGELAPINPIPPGIVEADPEKDIRLIEKLLNDDSSPHSPEELNSEIPDAIIESFSPSPIPVEDSDSLMEEIDIFLTSGDSIPPGIENDDYDSEGDILFLEELLNEDSLSRPEYETFHFDRYNVQSSFRPPEKPPDDEGIYFNIEPDPGDVTTKVVDDTSDNSTRELYVHVPNVLFDLESKKNDWKKILYDDPINDLIFDPGGDIDEIDAFLDIDIPMNIKDGFYDSEGDVLYLESLLSDDTTPNSPPEVFLDRDSRSLSDINDLESMVKIFDPGIHEKFFSPTYVSLPFEDRHYLFFAYVIRIFPYFTYSVESPFLLSSGSEDTIFDPGISAFHFSSLEPVAIARILKTLVLVVLSIVHSIFNPSHAYIWESDILDLIDSRLSISLDRDSRSLSDINDLESMDCPDFEDSRARGFVHHSLDLQSFACLYMGIRYPRSY